MEYNKHCKKMNNTIADEFMKIFGFKREKKKLTICDFIPEIITWETIEKVMGKKEYKKFLKWMNGQTCVQEGVYSWDLENYLRGGKSFD